MATRINRYIESVSAFDNLEIDLIRGSETPLRNSTGDLSDLIESISHVGLLQPILVRPAGEKFEVIAGNRRFEACKKLKQRKIKAIVIELDDKSAYEIAITENVQRKTLDPLEEGLAFKKYCAEFGWGSETELARKIGKSQEYVSHRIKLLSLPDEVKEALRQKRIALAAAEELMWIKADEVKKDIASLVFSKKLSMHEVRRLVKTINTIPDSESSLEQDTFFSASPRQDIDGKNEYSKITSELILVLRIALIRMDDLASKATDPRLKQLAISKRIAVHSIVDELISERKRSLQMIEVKARLN
jgi:ParB family chromosome partitioning protein